MVTLRQRLQRAFTVIELMVVLTAIAILLSIAAPRYIAHLDSARDTALRHNLKAMREAMDQFHADRAVPPANLQELVQARYLREIPEDPVTRRRDTWQFVAATNGTATAASGAAAPGRADVRSGAAGNGQDGTPYASW